MGAAGAGSEYDTVATGRLIRDASVTSFITRLRGAPAILATQNNALQEIAERTRLGIPLTISTDPRNHFQYTFGASVQPGGFSQWPETLGFAALRDASLVRRFADIASADGRFDRGAGRNCVDRESLRRGWRLVARTIEERDVDRVPALRERLCG